MSALDHPWGPAVLGAYRLGAVHEITLRDGTQHRLVQLHRGGVPSLHMRALVVAGSKRLQIFDVRRIARQLAAELLVAPARDVPGLVHYTLRGICPTAAALQRAVADVCESAAVPVPVDEPADAEACS